MAGWLAGWLSGRLVGGLGSMDGPRRWLCLGGVTSQAAAVDGAAADMLYP